MCQTKREICFNTINPTIPHSNEQEIAAICGCVSLRFAPTVLQHPAKVGGANRLAAAAFCGRASHRLSVTVRLHFKAVASRLTSRKHGIFLCACVARPPPPPTLPPLLPVAGCSAAAISLQIQPLISDLGGCLTGGVGGWGFAGCMRASVNAHMRADLDVGRVGARWRCRGGEFMTGPLLRRH